MKKKSIKKFVLYIILVFLIYVYTVGVLPVWVAEKNIIREYENVTADEGFINLQKQIQEGRRAPERVRCIDDNVEALKWRLRLIESAEKSVDISSFEFSNDKSGHLILAALNDAADRGVEIRILADAYHGARDIPRDHSFQALLNKPEVEIKLYNPLNPLKLWKVNYRLHDKLFIVDGKTYIAGGRNTNDLFLGEGKGKKKRHNKDRDLLVFSLNEPGSSDYVLKRFNDLWNEKSAKKIIAKGNTDDSELKATMKQLKSKDKDLGIPPDGDRDGEPVDSIVLLFNNSKAEIKKPVLWNELVYLMEAGEDVIIETPYYMGDKKMDNDLKKSKSKYSLILNSPDTGANPWGSSELIFSERNLKKTVNLYENYGSHSNHRKTILLGDNLSVIGSFNMDIRSVYLDTEMIMLVESENLNKSLRESAVKQMKKSKVLTSNDVINPVNMKVKPLKRAFLVLMKMLTVLLHPLL